MSEIQSLFSIFGVMFQSKVPFIYCSEFKETVCSNPGNQYALFCHKIAFELRGAYYTGCSRINCCTFKFAL